MMRSMYSAVSGLKTHQTRMDVIGNNIANVNTEAFKASSVRFTEIMYQTTASASGGDAANGVGGVNAKQIGLGVTTGSTKINITSAGAAETTGDPFDIKLTDSQTTNFFIVSDGKNRFFTRAGSFYIDGNGFLCMSSTGYTVQGWQTTVDADTGEVSILKDTVSPLQLMSPNTKNSAPEATTDGHVLGILDKNDTNVTDPDKGYTMNLSLYDDLGYSYTAKFTVKATDAEGVYYIALTDIQDSNGKTVVDNSGNPVYDPENPATSRLGEFFKPQYLVYDGSKGTFTGMTEVTADITDAAAVRAAGKDARTTVEGQDVKDRVKSITLELKGKLKVDGSGVPELDANGNKQYDAGYINAAEGRNFANVNIDFSSMQNSNNGGVSTLSLKNGTSAGVGTGKKLGALTGITIDQSGFVYGAYNNGNTVLLGQIPVAQFANASGLEKIGENCYKTTLNSGDFDGIGVAINADGSKMTSGQIEMSNVDLSAQFTDMIVTQRGFQANSRVITTSDTLLEELINLKR